MGMVDDTDGRPDESIARGIARELCGREPESVRRFSMGIGHWVYDVGVAEGEKLVVRVGSPDQHEDFAGAVHWSRQLRPIGVPLPSLLATGKHDHFPYMVLERLAGEDLGLVYDQLALEQKKAIAAQIFRVQRRVASLGEGRGYGFVRAPDSPHRSSWRRVIDDSIERSRSRMASAGSLFSRVLETVSKSAGRLDDYFSRVRPTPFLDDTTTKNVLVHCGRLTGIVDVDWICFGDPLLTVALTRASLLGSGRDLAYTDHWCELFAPSLEQQAALRFYTALFLLDFMSELGHRFNRDTPTITLAEVERLEILLQEQLHGS
jgi:hypothetical protein